MRKAFFILFLFIFTAFAIPERVTADNPEPRRYTLERDPAQQRPEQGRPDFQGRPPEPGRPAEPERPAEPGRPNQPGWHPEHARPPYPEHARPPYPEYPPEHTRPPYPGYPPENARPPYPGRPPEQARPPYPGHPPEHTRPPYPGRPPEHTRPPYPGRPPEHVRPPYPGRPPEHWQPPYPGFPPGHVQPPVRPPSWSDVCPPYCGDNVIFYDPSGGGQLVRPDQNVPRPEPRTYFQQGGEFERFQWPENSGEMTAESIRREEMERYRRMMDAWQ